METKGQRVSMWPVRFLVPIRLNQCSNVLHKISLYPTGTSRLVFKWNPLEVRLVNCNSLPRRYIRKWHKRHKKTIQKPCRPNRLNVQPPPNPMTFSTLQCSIFQHHTPFIFQVSSGRRKCLTPWRNFFFDTRALPESMLLRGSTGVYLQARHRSTPEVDPWVFRRRSEGDDLGWFWRMFFSEKKVTWKWKDGWRWFQYFVIN